MGLLVARVSTYLSSCALTLLGEPLHYLDILDGNERAVAAGALEGRLRAVEPMLSAVHGEIEVRDAEEDPAAKHDAHVVHALCIRGRRRGERDDHDREDHPGHSDDCDWKSL